jgi:Fe2+ or Zn2+ uptake regulation protein
MPNASRRRAPADMAMVENPTEMAMVRRALDVLASARMLAPLSEADQARYEELTRHEHELLDVDADRTR